MHVLFVLEIEKLGKGRIITIVYYHLPQKSLSLIENLVMEYRCDRTNIVPVLNIFNSLPCTDCI